MSESFKSLSIYLALNVDDGTYSSTVLGGTSVGMSSSPTPRQLTTPPEQVHDTGHASSMGSAQVTSFNKFESKIANEYMYKYMYNRYV